MTAPVFSIDDETANAAAAELASQADALDDAATAATESIATIQAQAGDFQTQWQPEGIHSQKVTEVVNLLQRKAKQAGWLAGELRSKATNVRNLVVANADVQDTAAANTASISTEGIATP